MAQIEWSMKGRYLKNCNCIATCPCDTVGIPYPDPGCEGMAGMRIDRGHFGEVELDGLSWVAVFRWPGALHEGNGAVQLFIDQRANQEQRDALLKIIYGQAGNAWFEFLAGTFSTVHEPQFVPIEFDFDRKQRKARVVVPGALETVSAPLMLPDIGQEHRVVVRLPEGREFIEMDVAQTAVLKGTGVIKFDHTHTHSTMAELEHTQAGVRM